PLLHCGLWLLLYTFAVMANVVGVTTLRRFSIRWIGAIVIQIAFAVSAHVTFSSNPAQIWLRLLTWLTVLGGFTGHLNVSLRAPLTRGWNWLRWITVVAVAITGLIASVLVVRESPG